MGTKRGGSLNLATSALVASIAIADNLFVKDSTRHSLAEVKTDIIPISNFNDADFTVKPKFPEDFDISKATASLSPLDLNQNFDLEQAYITFDMRENFLQKQSQREDASMMSWDNEGSLIPLE